MFNNMCTFSHVKTKKSVMPIAHEIVYPEDLPKNIRNSFRFICSNYVYHIDSSLGQLASQTDFFPEKIYRNVTGYKARCNRLNQDVIDTVFNILNLDFQSVLKVAFLFQKSNCNAVSFTEDTVVFFNAVEQSFGEKCRNKK